MVTKAKRDFGMKFIEETTGLNVAEFLQRFRASSNKIKTDILKDDMYADAIRVLTLPLDDRKTAFKNILINPDQRKDRIILNGFYFKDQPTIDFAKSIKASFDKPKEFVDMQKITGATNVQGLSVPLPKFTNDQLKQFATLYNSENPFLLSSLRYHMGDGAFQAVQRKALSNKFINNDTGKRISTLFSSIPSPEKDAAVQRAYVVLQNYKKMVPKATGAELRLGPNNLGEFDINQLLLQDDVLSKFLVKDGKLSTFRRQQILKQLNREGLIKELGLDKFYLKGGNPKVIGTDDPKLQQFLIDQSKTSNPTLKTSQMLNEQYMKEKLNQGQAPFVTDPNPKFMGMSMGGDVVSDNILEQANVFEDPSLPEVEVANLFGKVPLWAIQNIDKFKMLTQNLSKAEKKQLESLEKKVGTIEEVNVSKDPLDESIGAVSDDVGTSVVEQAAKKQIIDSPEAAESVFYSNLEARLMDPNTPPVFNTAEQFFNFMQQKGISKVEIEDNILTNYIKQAQKNNTPLAKGAMLSIVRQAPQRKIETVTYGFGGDKPAKYPGYQEPGAIDGSYREQVLYLNPSAIPGDPDQLPGSVHDFTERYVIGWSRLTDRNGTIPGAEGLFTTADKKMLATLRKNQTKLYNQLVGLETSALRKLDREGLVNVDLNIDDLTAPEISTIIDARVSDLERIDPALLQQIRQFKSKLQDDLVKVKNLEQAQAGSKVIVTFADEIQSDILQQAKKLELDLKEQISDLMDLPLNERMARLARDRLSYQGKAREVEPQVLEYYTRNETIFRPMFKTAEDMQQFVDEFRLNKKIFTDLAKQGPSVEPQLLASAKKAAAKEKQMLEELDVGLSDAALKQLFPNVPFKNRMEWGSALIKRDIALAAKRLFVDKAEGASQWYAVTPAKYVKNRYSQSGGTNTPINERTSDMKGIGTEEFYGGPDSTDFKGKHYTSTVEKILKRAAKDNNSEFKIIDVDGVGEVFAIKITPEMLLPHKTHRKRGGLVYTPESIIDIFEAA